MANPFPFVAGSVLQAAELNGIGETYTTYTPVWSSTGTQPTIGNGSVTGRYVRINKLIQVQIRIVIGSTSTAGTGDYRLTFPVNAEFSGEFGWGACAGSGFIYDASAGTAYDMQASYVNSATTFRGLVYANSTQGTITWGQGSPITPATADEFVFNFIYEAD